MTWSYTRILLHIPKWFSLALFYSLYAAPKGTSIGMRAVIFALYLGGRKDVKMGSAENMRVQIKESKYCYALSSTLSSPILFIKYPLIPTYNASTVLPPLVKFLSSLTSSLPSSIAASISEFGGEIALMGDSAGGGLALSVAIELAKIEGNGVKVKELVLIAPWTDVSCSAPGAEKVEPRDPMLRVSPAQVCGVHWSSALSEKEGSSVLKKTQAPLPSPHFADLSLLSKAGTRTSVIVGTNDILITDNTRFVKKYEEETKGKGRGVEMKVWEGGIHCFPMLPPGVVRESREAREWIASRMRGE